MKQKLFSIFVMSIVLSTSASEPNHYLDELESMWQANLQPNANTEIISQKLSAIKTEFISELLTNKNEIPDLVHQIQTTATIQPAATYSGPLFSDLMEILERTDESAFMKLSAQLAVDSKIDVKYRDKTILLVYLKAAGTKTDANLKKQAAQILYVASGANELPKPQLTGDDGRFHLHAIQLLIGYEPIKGMKLVGLNPILGKRALLQIVQNNIIGFNEKEPFAFFLASVDKSYVDFYYQSIKVMFLDNENQSARTKLHFAERLSVLGRISNQELDNYRKIEHENRKVNGGGAVFQIKDGE